MKRFSKKLAALLLVAVMAVSLLPTSAFADETDVTEQPTIETSAATEETNEAAVSAETKTEEAAAPTEVKADEAASDEVKSDEAAAPAEVKTDDAAAVQVEAKTEENIAPQEPTTPETPAPVPENSITSQPKDATVAPFESAVFEVEVNGKVSSYKWQYSKDGGRTWKDYGSRKSYITVTGNVSWWSSNNGYMYRCIVTFKDKSKVTSDAATLYVGVSQPKPVEQSFTVEASEDLKFKTVDVDAKVPNGTDITVVDADLSNEEISLVDNAIEGVKVTAEDIIAIDISFEYDGDENYQPDGDTTVKIESSEIKEGAKLVRIHNGEAEEIKIESIEEGENGKKILTFKSDKFSTFVLVWGEDASATITWGYYDGGEFKELEEGSTVTLDTTASTVSLENTYAGYYMIGATYIAPGSSTSVDISPARLTKVENGWQITTVTKDDEGTIISTETVTIADGSEIHVIYGPKSGTTPSGSGDDKIPSPTTEKTVTNNGDGTYTITLDTTATQVTETTQTGANVLLILDRTYSMAGSMGGGKDRWQVAQEAAELLIDTLDCDVNDIDLSLVTFGNVREVENSMTWTKDYQSVVNKINSMDHKGRNDPNGTNWESALWYAYSYLGTRDTDDTYVIFLTDGEPNRHGTTSGSQYTWNNVPRCIADAQEYANDITALSKVHLYGVFCGSDSGYSNLSGLIEAANGEGTINGTDEDTIKSAFEGIAQTIVDNLGASNVAVDDGVPSLSNISANVVGEAGGYEYYIKGKDDADFSVWNDAPGAIYSQDNGVTWDLSSAGTLPAGTTYRIKFTVWPSQAAYDLIADLNNGLKEYDSLPADQKAAVTGNKTDGYTLVTNTHLNTTYTFNNTEYSDAPEDLQYASMPLPTSTVSVVKEWPANMVDSYGAAVYRDPVTGETKTATEIELTLQRDSADYLKFTVKGSEGWKKDEIYISSGNMTVANGVATIHEPGHDYQIVEPPAFLYYWDLISDVYHPMVINGVNTLLVLDVDATSANVDNETYFAIGKDADGNDKIYKKHAASDNTLKASNYRRSNLNLTKQIFDYDGETAKTDENAEFVYKAKVTDAYSTDGYVWFSAMDTTGQRVKDTWVTGDDVEAELGSDGQPNGYFYAPNGTELTMTIKAGWNVRFLNIYHGSTFSFEETDMPGNYEFSKVEAAAQYSFVHTSSADWYTATAGSTTGKIEGTITEPNNNYTITYSNKVKPEFYIYHSGVAGDGNLETIPMTAVAADGTYNLYAKTTSGTLYGGYYLDYAGKGDYKDDGVKGATGVAYTGMNYDWNWTEDEAQTVDGTKMKPKAGETYYIKEVPTCYLRNYHQINYLKATGALTALYLISAVDDLNYSETGFILQTDDNQTATVVSSMTYKNTATGKSVTLKANTVFKSLGITGTGSEKDYLTYWDATSSKYFAIGSFTVLPYWVTPDGITVNGISTRTITTDLTKSGTSKSDN